MAPGKLDDGLALVPPMGWNSWNRFGCQINEQLIRETAVALVSSGMRDAGYRYVVVDDCWHERERDARGNLQANTRTFPGGIKSLADYIHPLGLKFGIYTDAGKATCQGFPGSFNFEDADARLFAEWGVDYVKVDWCHSEGLDAKVQYGKWRDAVLKAGRPMVLSICEWGRSRPWEWASTVGHLWRTTDDIRDSWGSIMDILERQVDLYPYAGPGHWNDPDMLEVGNGGMSETECRSHFSLWCMLSAPLMAGNDLCNMTKETQKILTSPELIAINQDIAGTQGRRIEKSLDSEIWLKQLDGGDLAVLLLNRSLAPCDITVHWSNPGFSFHRASVRDACKGAVLGLFEDCYTARNVPPHGCSVLRVSGID